VLDVRYYNDVGCQLPVFNQTVLPALCYTGVGVAANFSATFDPLSAATYRVTLYECPACGCSATATLDQPLCTCQPYLGPFDTYSVCPPGQTPPPPTTATTASGGPTTTTTPAAATALLPAVWLLLLALVAAQF